MIEKKQLHTVGGGENFSAVRRSIIKNNKKGENNGYKEI